VSDLTNLLIFLM